MRCVKFLPPESARHRPVFLSARNLPRPTGSAGARSICRVATSWLIPPSNSSAVACIQETPWGRRLIARFPSPGSAYGHRRLPAEIPPDGGSDPGERRRADATVETPRRGWVRNVARDLELRNNRVAHRSGGAVVVAAATEKRRSRSASLRSRGRLLASLLPSMR
jgi:hypothetical protein